MNTQDAVARPFIIRDGFLSNNNNQSYFLKVGADRSHEEGHLGDGVRIGIIDSGYDFLGGTVNIDGSTAITGDAQDALGHGTMVTNIIDTIAPSAELYVIKTTVEDTGGLTEAIAFDDLSANDELVGNLFGYGGVYAAFDLSSIESGEYEFNVQVLNNNGE
jgi:hypothetical protein